MMTCRKVYADIPFAHRQHLHDGHCALIHGHSWSFALTFGCHERDASGFVIDFGKLRFIREELETRFDHACVFATDDPLRAGHQLHKMYQVDEQDPRSRPPAPLGGKPALVEGR